MYKLVPKNGRKTFLLYKLWAIYLFVSRCFKSFYEQTIGTSFGGNQTSDLVPKRYNRLWHTLLKRRIGKA
jgi:hypothetical protein